MFRRRDGSPEKLVIRKTTPENICGTRTLYVLRTRGGRYFETGMSHFFCACSIAACSLRFDSCVMYPITFSFQDWQKTNHGSSSISLPTIALISFTRLPRFLFHQPFSKTYYNLITNLSGYNLRISLTGKCMGIHLWRVIFQ